HSAGPAPSILVRDSCHSPLLKLRPQKWGRFFSYEIGQELRTPSCTLVSFVVNALQLSRLCNPIKELPHTRFVDREYQFDEFFLIARIRQRPSIDRIVPRIAIELLNRRPRLFISTPHVARPNARVT